MSVLNEPLFWLGAVVGYLAFAVLVGKLLSMSDEWEQR
jgi:hypothetical protein